MEKEFDEDKTTKVCDCQLCQRSREFKKHLNDSVTTKSAQEFFISLFEHLYEVEEELDFKNIYLSNLKKNYPEIYCKIRQL